MYNKSHPIFEELGTPADMAGRYGSFGSLYLMRDDLNQAEEMITKCLVIYEELGDRAGIAQFTCNLGILFEYRGDWAGAAAHFRRSLAIAEELGMPDTELMRQSLAKAETHLAGGPSTGSGGNAE